VFKRRSKCVSRMSRLDSRINQCGRSPAAMPAEDFWHHRSTTIHFHISLFRVFIHWSTTDGCRRVDHWWPIPVCDVSTSFCTLPSFSRFSRTFRLAIGIEIPSVGLTLVHTVYQTHKAELFALFLHCIVASSSSSFPFNDYGWQTHPYNR